MGWGSVVERLVRALVVVGVDPRPDLHSGLFQGDEAAARKLLLKRPVRVGARSGTVTECEGAGWREGRLKADG